jgi:hypothetical protein
VLIEAISIYIYIYLLSNSRMAKRLNKTLPYEATISDEVEKAKLTEANVLTIVLRQKLQSIQFSPIEGHQSVMCLASINSDVIDQFATAQTSDDIEKWTEMMALQLTSSMQLDTCIKEALTEVKRSLAKHKSKLDGLAKKAQEQAQKGLLKIQGVDADATKKALLLSAQKQVSPCFSIPWPTVVGAQDIPSFTSIEELMKVLHTDGGAEALYSKPFVVASSHIKELAAADQEFGKTIVRFGLHFGKSPGARSPMGYDQAPALVEKHIGVEAARNAAMASIPRANSMAPHVKDLGLYCERSYFFGCTADSQRHVIDQDGLGSLEIFAQGKVQVIMTSLVSIKNTAKVMDSMLSSATHILGDLSNDKAATEFCSTGGPIFHTCVDAENGAVLYTPPGYSASSRAMNQQIALGLKFHVFPKCKELMSNVELLKPGIPTLAKSIDAINTVMAA